MPTTTTTARKSTRKPRKSPRKPAETVISSQVSADGQSVDFVEVLAVPGHKLRVRICSDSYEAQCSARVSRWDGEKWQAVHFLTAAARKTPVGLVHSLHVRRNVENARADFAADRAELVRVALAILA